MNPYRITAEEQIPGWDGHAVRGELKHFNWNWRISMNGEGWMLLWLIVDMRWETDDEHPAWLCAAAWQPSMPMVVNCVPWIARQFFQGGCRELVQADIDEMCLEITMLEAGDENKTFDRVKAYALRQALEAA